MKFQIIVARMAGWMRLVVQTRAQVVFVAVLGAILLGRLALNLYVFNLNDNFFMLTGDDLYRTLYAYEWSQQPDFKPVWSLWTSGQIWLIGALLRLYPHPVIAVPILNTLLGLGSIVLVCLIARDLLRSRWLGLTVAVVAAFQPIIIWLSLCGLAEGPGIFAVLIGAFGWVRYRMTGIVWLAVLAAVGFLCATALKIEYVAFAGGYTLLVAYEVWCLHGSSKPKFLIACIPIVWLFVLAFLVWCKVNTGDFLWYASAYRQDYQRSWIAASTQSTLTRLGFYLSMLFQNWPVWISLACLGLFCMATRRDMRRSLADLIVLSALPFAMLSVSAMTSGVPGNLGPGPRHVAAYMVLFLIPAVSAIPLMGQAVMGAVPRLLKRQDVAAATPAAILAVLTLCSVLSGASKSRYPPIQSGAAAVNLGKALDSLWHSGAIDGQEKVLFEPWPKSNSIIGNQSRFDALTVWVFRPGGIIIDDKRLSGQVGISGLHFSLTTLSLPPGRPADALKEANVRVVVVHSPESAKNLSTFMWLAGRYGNYSLYVNAGDVTLKQALSQALQMGKVGKGDTIPISAA